MVDTPLVGRGEERIHLNSKHVVLIDLIIVQVISLMYSNGNLFIFFTESMARKVGFTQQEERFFYEYLRVAGDRSPLECARDISNTLGTKTPDEILSFYQGTVDLIYKDKTGLAKGNHRRTHKILTKFYDTRVAPVRQKQQQSGEVSDKSPNGSKKEGTTIGCQGNKNERFRERKHGFEGDVTSQLQAAPFLEILFVPFEEDLANTLASSGCDPCPRLKFSHNEKITSVVDQLQNTWNKALVNLGSGGIRLKAPDDSPPAIRACEWGDPARDQNLTLFDLMNALRITSPSTLGYTWEHQPPQTVSPQETGQNHREKLNKCSPRSAQKYNSNEGANKGGNLNIDSISLAPFSPSKGQVAEGSEMKWQRNIPVFHETPVELTKSIRSESKKRNKSSCTEARKRKSFTSTNESKNAADLRPEQIMRNALAQYTDVIKQYNFMGARYPQNYMTHQQKPPVSQPIELTDRERSILEFIRKEENLGTFESFAGTCSPKGKADVQTPISGKKKSRGKDLSGGVIDELAGLSPPSSFKLPPEFHKISGQSGTPIKSLCGIFDSCQPLSPGKNKTGKSEAHPGEVSQLPEELLNPTMSLLSLLDGMSNSHWVSKLDEEREQGTSLGNRPFAKLFDA